MNRMGWRACGAAIVLGSAARGQVTQRVTLTSAGLQANGNNWIESATPDLRYLVITSDATNLVPGDTNGHADVFVRDRFTGTIERVSVDSSGVQANGDSLEAAISADGRYVAFGSHATNLVPGDSNGTFDVFVRDRQNGTTERVSVSSGGAQGNGDSGGPSISSDGRYVAFYSNSINLVPGDTNGVFDIFVRDRQSGTTEIVSISTAGVQADSLSQRCTISADGRFVAFASYASTLVPGDTNSSGDIFVRDRQSGTTERVSVSSGGVQGNMGGDSTPSISADGRFVTFTSESSNLVAGDTNAVGDVFLRDRQSGTTERVSVDSAGVQGNADTGFGRNFVSDDGRFVGFDTLASNLAPGDTNLFYDVFVRDRQNGTTVRMSLDSAGAQANNDCNIVAMSADGRSVLIGSAATNLVSGDTNAAVDGFLHDRNATGFTSLCDPGAGGVHVCPCGNAPSGPGRGCNNSASTGGASLSASGIAYLSTDSLVFTTSGEKPTATSTLWQGPSSPAAGIVFGQGVRCVNGSLKRLFNKSAVGGSITVPDFAAGDPRISARSAAKGAPISPGQTCYYFVSYRDPIVLGGCPATSTFNVTQTGRIDWQP